MTVPEVRIRRLNDAGVNSSGDCVIYWMIASRRTRFNFSLQRAIELAADLGRPVLVFEALRLDYPWASDRFHRFILDGMADNARSLAGTAVGYYPYVEPRQGEGRGLLQALSRSACAVITDDYPAFFLPRAVKAAAGRLAVPLELVDSNGILPMRDADRVFPTAHSFRRFLQQRLPYHFEYSPAADPLSRYPLPAFGSPPSEVISRWPPAADGLLSGDEPLSALQIDHKVQPVPARGGAGEAGRTLDGFVRDRLAKYASGRNDPARDLTSGLSPYLHFGHVSAHEMFARVMNAEGWAPDRIAHASDGRRSGWWGVSQAAEAFIDQLITWRELGFNFCHLRGDYDRFESLPGWARTTLEEHAADPRPYQYSLAELETAETHDEIWNAAQRQLLAEGRIHNYLRMLWGKKILEWTASPPEALAVMIHLNNKYALDGRDPNSYSGILWCLGRYDRPWGPERPIFGKVRYMSSENTARKLRIESYLRAWG